MVQVLPYVPSFGERLIPVLQEAGAQIGEGIQQRNARTALQKILASQQPQGNREGQVGTGQNPTQQGQQSRGINPMEAIQLHDLVAKGYGKAAADVYTKTALEKQKLEQKEAQQIRKEERALSTKANQEFFEKHGTERNKLPEEQLALEFIQDAIKSGDIDPWSKAHLAEIAKDFGAPASIVKGLETPGSKEFKTARKTFIANTIKDSFRGTTNQREITLAEDMIAELGVSKEANLASSWALQAGLDIRKQRVQLTDQLLEQGVSPSKIPSAVEKILEPYIRQTKDEYFEAIRTLRKQVKGGK